MASFSRLALLLFASAKLPLTVATTTSGHARRVGQWPHGVAQVRSETHPSAENCTWRVFGQRLDHFGSAAGIFNQRYCLYTAFWGHDDNGKASSRPIFFYTGNESPVEVYINNTGLMWQLGERMGALIVFAEHRYEPLSHPDLGRDGPEDCFAYCTTAQALADYVDIISSLRQEFHATDNPVIAFGGSYGGMLAGWMRIRYPDVIAGSIAASAPVWGLATTLLPDRFDWTARSISKGVSAEGGASDRCLSNFRLTWPLIKEVSKSPSGLKLLGDAASSCHPLHDGDELIQWATSPFFLMAEGNYPFPSTYITFSVGPGYFSLPPWPMKVACQHLDKEFGIVLDGSVADVHYKLRLGDIEAVVDWDSVRGNGPLLSEDQIRKSGVMELVAGLRDAVGVWYNVTEDRACFDMASAPHSDSVPEATVLPGGPGGAAVGEANAGETLDTSCPACPPCEGCPTCGVARCNTSANKQCSYTKAVSKTFSWDGVTCNDDLWLYNTVVQGTGRDMFWPPTVKRGATMSDLAGPRGKLIDSSCGIKGLAGAPKTSDRWNSWLTTYYGGANISQHRNIVWSNGGLDPWAGGGVYPPEGGIDGPMVQNISADGSQVALLIDLGGHHLDLFFSDPRDPECVVEVRKIEERMIAEWCREWSAARREANSGAVLHI